MSTLSHWHVVLPLKGGDQAKSRFGLGPGKGAELARAMALDVLAALGGAGVGSVCIVGPDPRQVQSGDEHLRDVLVLPDPGQGLNAAASLGLSVAPEGYAAAVLLPDLPALGPGDVEAALSPGWLSHEPAFVPDQAGTGTVLLTVPPGSSVVPAFGTGSAQRHTDAGFVCRELDLPRLRTDVDTVADLELVRARGVGRHTAQVLASCWAATSG